MHASVIIQERGIIHCVLKAILWFLSWQQWVTQIAYGELIEAQVVQDLVESELVRGQDFFDASQFLLDLVGVLAILHLIRGQSSWKADKNAKK